MEHPIGTLPRTPFPASRDFPSRGNERYEGKTAIHILHVPFRRFLSLVVVATTLSGGKKSRQHWSWDGPLILSF
jgi:hypothetical protein